jgi:hypothetical protein
MQQSGMLSIERRDVLLIWDFHELICDKISVTFFRVCCVALGGTGALKNKCLDIIMQGLVSLFTKLCIELRGFSL